MDNIVGLDLNRHTRNSETHRLGKRAHRGLPEPLGTRPNVRATEVLLAELRLVAPPNTLCEDRRRLPTTTSIDAAAPGLPSEPRAVAAAAHRTQTDYNTKAPWLWSQEP